MSNLKISDVFVPRSAEVNYRSYVAREYLEDALTEGIDGSNHLLLYGESGTGKSWLYKKVFQDNDIAYMIIDLALAAAKNDLDAAFLVNFQKPESAKVVGYEESKKASTNVVFAEGGLEHKKQYKIIDGDPFLRCLQDIRGKAKRQKAVIVFDNFERILNKPDLVESFSNYLVLLDNPLYSNSKVKILIVGVPVDVGQFFYQVDHAHIVVNRIEELPEVDRFTEEEISQLVKMGFVNELGYKLDPLAIGTLVGYISHFSDQIPQHVQALCKLFAKMLLPLKENTIMQLNVEKCLIKTLGEWIQQTMQSDYTHLKRVNHERDPFLELTIIALGRIPKQEFESIDVLDEFEKMLGLETNISEASSVAVLKFLASDKIKIIKETAAKNVYCFSNPKHKIAIRIMTHINEDDPNQPVYSLKDLTATANSIKWMRKMSNTAEDQKRLLTFRNRP